MAEMDKGVYRCYCEDSKQENDMTRFCVGLAYKMNWRDQRESEKQL